jgi:putative glycosyltransferase (TIGR04372 family)
MADSAASIAAPRRSLALSPGLATAWLRLAEEFRSNPSPDMWRRFAARAVAASDQSDAMRADLGIFFQTAGSYLDAARHFRELLTSAPERWDCLANLASTFYFRASYAIAATYYGRALCIEAGNETLIRLATSSLAYAGETAAALTLSERASQPRAKSLVDDARDCRCRIATDPSDAARHADLAITLYRNGEFALYIAFARRSLAIDPKVHDWRNVARTYRRLDDTAEAERCFSRYVRRQHETMSPEAAKSARVLNATPNDVSALGELALQADLYLKAVNLGYLPRRRLLWPVHGQVICNRAYLEMLREHIDFPEDAAACATLEADTSIPTHETDWLAFPDGSVRIKERAMLLVQREWEARRLPPIMKLDDQSLERGRSTLRRLGLRESDWFIVLHVRDAGYNLATGRNESVHVLRNARIENYADALKHVVDRGGAVFRIGHPSSRRMPTGERIFDIAHSDIGSPFFDIFLCAQARFYLGVPSGPSTVASSFGVPSLLTDCLQAKFHAQASAGGFLGRDRFLVKLFWSRTMERYLVLEEMLRLPLKHETNPSDFKSWGLECRDNTPDDILAAICEYLDRLDDVHEPDPESEALHRRVQGIYDATDTPLISRMADSFLRSHKATLGL